MAIHGNLATFAITDLLQWIENARKTGILTVERSNVVKTVVVEDGKVVACSSNDPPSLLGQRLLAKGMITKDILQQALMTQEKDGGNLGAILVQMGAVTAEQVTEQISAKAEETLYSLFDYEDADFQFDEDAPVPTNRITVELKIQTILMDGLKRFDEMQHIREVFPSRHVVLARTEKPLPEKVASNRVAQRILGAVNGERTMEELLLHARATEYLVAKFLYELHRMGLIRVETVREPNQADDGSSQVSAGDLATEIEVAQTLLARGEPNAALAVLSASARANPGLPTIRHMIEKAESALLQASVEEFRPTMVPVKTVQGDFALDEDLSPGEAYMLTLVDGATDVKAIQWIAPMRQVDVVRALHSLLDRGVIEMREAS